MNFLNGLNAWQMILWIAAVEIVSLPLLVGMMSSIFSGYFKAKEEYERKRFKAFWEVAAKGSEELQKIFQKKSDEERKKEALEFIEEIRERAKE